MQDLNSEQTRAFLRTAGLDRSRRAAFSYVDNAGGVRYDWHRHRNHQLFYAFEGVGEIEAGNARYFLPPQRAAWISAGTLHRTTLAGSCGISVYFHPRWISWKTPAIQVIAAPPLLRELVKGAARWSARDRERDPVRDPYFRTLAFLCREWLEAPLPYWLPETQDPQLARAIVYTREHLESATAQGASAAAAMSDRTFRRQFSASLGISWREYLHKVRLLRAMDLLATSRTSIAQIASELGFATPSAFTRAFKPFASEAPSAYRVRVARDGCVSFAGDSGRTATPEGTHSQNTSRWAPQDSG